MHWWYWCKNASKLPLVTEIVTKTVGSLLFSVYNVFALSRIVCPILSAFWLFHWCVVHFFVFVFCLSGKQTSYFYRTFRMLTLVRCVFRSIVHISRLFDAFFCRNGRKHSICYWLDNKKETELGIVLTRSYVYNGMLFLCFCAAFFRFVPTNSLTSIIWHWVHVVFLLEALKSIFSTLLTMSRLLRHSAVSMLHGCCIMCGTYCQKPCLLRQPVHWTVWLFWQPSAVVHSHCFNVRVIAENIDWLIDWMCVYFILGIRAR